MKIKFQSPIVEKVALTSIFRKHLDSSFESRDSPPTLIYSRTRNIGCTVFNYTDVVDNVIANDWNDNASTECDCSKSLFFVILIMAML